MKTILSLVIGAALASAQLKPQPQTPAAPPAKVNPEQLGDIYMARKMFRAAADTYREHAGNSAVLWNKVGIAYHQMGDLNGAKKSYERSLHFDGKYADAINNLGTVYYAEKKFRGAISRYRKALTLAPNSASIWSNLGTAYYARGKFDEMTMAYSRALQLDPDVFENHGLVGTRMMDRSVADRARYHYEMARMYAVSGKNELALQYLRKALEEGFKEKEKLQAKEFSALRETKEFQDLMAAEPRVL
jgi:tetratricopeptide (TPR) repeat protein